MGAKKRCLAPPNRVEGDRRRCPHVITTWPTWARCRNSRGDPSLLRVHHRGVPIGAGVDDLERFIQPADPAQTSHRSKELAVENVHPRLGDRMVGPSRTHLGNRPPRLPAHLPATLRPGPERSRPTPPTAGALPPISPGPWSSTGPSPARDGGPAPVRAGPADVVPHFVVDQEVGAGETPLR